MKKVWMIGITVILLSALCFLIPCSISAGSMSSAVVTGTFDYPEAQKVLQIVNQQRAMYGLHPLTLDTSLTELAMFRAAECAVYYPTDSNHTRPNGQPCNTAPGFPRYNWSENVAAGQANASAVMTAWMNSEGHRNNILKSTRTSIGIGAFYHDGKYYWAQVFSGAAASSVPSYRAAEQRTVTVQVNTDMFSWSNSSRHLYEGTSIQFGLVFENTGWPSFSSTLNREYYNFYSADPTIAQVDAQGNITGMRNGTTTITIAPKNGAAALPPVTVSVTGVPKITKQPSSVCAKNGAKATVSVKASGEGLTYFWYYRDTDDDYYTALPASTKNTYSVTMSNAVANREVYCVVKNQYNVYAQTKIVTLYQAARITKQPSNGYAYSGKKATVKVTATGKGLTYRWYFKNPGSSKYTYTSAFKGNTYSVTMNKERAGRRVYCVVSDKFGNKVQSKSVVLDYKVKITTQPKSVCAKNGKTAKVTLKATGVGLTYRWYYKDSGESKYKYTSSFKGNSYYIKMNNARAGRRVLCIVKDKYGNKVQSNSVSLDKPVAITATPKNTIVNIGYEAKVTVKAKGGGLTYRWYFKDPGASKYRYTSSFKGSSYKIIMNDSRAGRRVFCKVTDRYGNSVQTKSVVLDQKVRIVQEPDWVVSAGFKKKAKVTVKAKGSGLTYRWYYKNPWDDKFTYTSSFKGNTYSITMNSARTGRRVYCVITDKYGNKVKSREVYLRLQSW